MKHQHALDQPFGRIGCRWNDRQGHQDPRRGGVGPSTGPGEGLGCQVQFEFDDNSFVFSSTPDGSQPLHPDSITTGFRRLCDKAGLQGVRLHDLRHLHATQLLAAGVPVRTVSGRLGHANAATTLNVYAHFLQASDRQAAEVIEGLLATPPPSTT